MNTLDTIFGRIFNLPKPKRQSPRRTPLSAGHRRIHPEDIATMRKTMRLERNYRLEFRYNHWDDGGYGYVIPAGLGFDDISYDGTEATLPDVEIPKEGEFWMDVQYAMRDSFGDGYSNPGGWITATFKDGRLIGMGEPR